MRHSFMESISRALARQRIASFRYQFPYMARGRRGPDPRPVLVAAVREAVDAAKLAAPGLPLLAGGKSMGGRMTSLAAAERPLEGVQGLVFLGFPLHPAGKPSSGRGDHLAQVDRPLLFLQGDRDRLANLDLLRPLIRGLGSRAELEVIEGADHSFHVPKASGREDDDILDALAASIASWASRLDGS